jgi:hypothetical protein
MAFARAARRANFMSRIVPALGPADAIASTDWHPHIASIIQVERSVATRNPSTGLLRQTNETFPVRSRQAVQLIDFHACFVNDFSFQ